MPADGHRRTYVGAMPGLIIQALRRVAVKDPGADDRRDRQDVGRRSMSGDPTAAMLEVLDPSQNNSFVDHYLNLPFDLSQCLFICTANNLFDIPAPLRDRMEIIQHRRLHDRGESRDRVALSAAASCSRSTASRDKDLQFTDESLSFISNRYSREAGLRNFERNLAAIMRKRARAKAEGEEGAWIVDVDEGRGGARHSALCASKRRRRMPEVGVVTGLAWTSTGGDIMLIEALKMPGTGRLTVTGQLGDVMRESVDAAYSYVRSRAKQLGIDDSVFRENDLHIHLPAGAIPKDGPSAGITLTLAIASALSGRPVRRDLAMTGEVTLRGKVLEIGGVKEKVLAAYRAGLRRGDHAEDRTRRICATCRTRCEEHDVHVRRANGRGAAPRAAAARGRRAARALGRGPHRASFRARAFRRSGARSRCHLPAAPVSPGTSPRRESRRNRSRTCKVRD